MNRKKLAQKFSGTLYLIQTDMGATLHAFTKELARDAKLKELRAKFPRTIYITKEIK